MLRLLETGLSNPQIAARIVVSLSTTKTHVDNIMQKLDARTRTEAIARARQLKLIQSRPVPRNITLAGMRIRSRVFSHSYHRITWYKAASANPDPPRGTD